MIMFRALVDYHINPEEYRALSIQSRAFIIASMQMEDKLAKEAEKESK